MRRVTIIGLMLVLGGCGTSAASPTLTTPDTLVSASPTTSVGTPVASQSASATASPEAAGALVDIGGRSLWLDCRGTGSPTVILESGMGGTVGTWDRVQPILAESTRVCTYDRANITPSDPADGPRTVQDSVDDLDALLTAAAVEAPYVMVGFSWGGIVTQLYAATSPDKIAGLVLVESNHPMEQEQFEEHLTSAQIEEDRAYLLDNPEQVDPFASFDLVQAAGPLPDVPLIVVTAGMSEGWPPDWDAELFDSLRAEQQAELATLTSTGRQVMAPNSRHHVPSQAPEVIVEAVEAILAELQ